LNGRQVFVCRQLLLLRVDIVLVRNLSLFFFSKISLLEIDTSQLTHEKHCVFFFILSDVWSSIA